MVGKMLDYLAADPPPVLKAVIALLRIVVQHEEYRQLVNKTLAPTSPDFEKRKPQLEAGYFSGSDFLLLVHACGDGGGTNMTIIASMLHQLKEWMLASDTSFISPQQAYYWDRKRIEHFTAVGILDNVLLGPAYVAQKYRQSVPAVFVRKEGDELTGTGFLVSDRIDAKTNVIVTAKHNVDPDEGITFASFGSPQGVSYRPLAPDWYLHPKLDLAAMPVECSVAPIPIYPVGLARVLARTITLGYPRIATTDASYLLAHGGELNAVVRNYHGEESLIISNVVAPGNSGGPVLDEAGLCVGMVVRALENKHEGGVSAANAALPAGAILEFITPLLT